MRIAGVVEDQTVGFPRRQAQTAANDLLVKTHRLGGAEDGDQVNVRGVEAGSQHRDVHQIAILLRFKRLDNAIPLWSRRFPGDQRGLRRRQQTGYFPGVFHGGGEDHRPFTAFGELHDLADDMRCYALLFFQFVVKIGFAEQAVALRLQTAEIVLHHRHIKAFRWRQVAVLNHIAQRQLIDAVAKQCFLIATYHAVVVKLIDPTLAEAKRGSRQAEQPELRIHLPQVAYDLLILAVVVIADTVAFIDDEQRKFTVKLIEVARHRLHAAKDHFAVALFTLQTSGKDIRLEAKGAVFRMVLRHQLFDVGQHQHAAAGQPGKLGNHQAFARAGGQDNGRRLGMATKPGEGGIDGFLLVGA